MLLLKSSMPLFMCFLWHQPCLIAFSSDPVTAFCECFFQYTYQFWWLSFFACGSNVIIMNTRTTHLAGYHQYWMAIRALWVNFYWQSAVIFITALIHENDVPQSFPLSITVYGSTCLLDGLLIRHLFNARVLICSLCEVQHCKKYVYYGHCAQFFLCQAFTV